jgi:predicted DNA-binding transcriptional regulator AlpA
VSKALSVAPPSKSQVTGPSNKRFVSDVEIEATFGINRRTLQNWRVLGRGPLYKKFGSAVRYDLRDVEAWIETCPTGGGGVPSCAVGER